MQPRLCCLALLSMALGFAWGEEVVPPLPPPLPPLSWKPPAKRPEFLERLKGEVFQKRFQNASANVNVQALTASKFPASAVLVRAVVPGGQAARLGLNDGDVLVARGGKPLTCVLDFDFGGNQAGELKWISPTGEAKSGQVAAGRLGINAWDFFRS